MGYRADEVGSILKVSDNDVVEAINHFAKEEMRKMKFNNIMERLGYDYEREEAKTLFG